MYRSVYKLFISLFMKLDTKENNFSQLFYRIDDKVVAYSTLFLKHKSLRTYLSCFLVE